MASGSMILFILIAIVDILSSQSSIYPTQTISSSSTGSDSSKGIASAITTILSTNITATAISKVHDVNDINSTVQSGTITVNLIKQPQQLQQNETFAIVLIVLVVLCIFCCCLLIISISCHCVDKQKASKNTQNGSNIPSYKIANICRMFSDKNNHNQDGNRNHNNNSAHIQKSISTMIQNYLSSQPVEITPNTSSNNLPLPPPLTIVDSNSFTKIHQNPSNSGSALPPPITEMNMNRSSSTVINMHNSGLSLDVDNIRGLETIQMDIAQLEMAKIQSNNTVSGIHEIHDGMRDTGYSIDVHRNDDDEKKDIMTPCGDGEERGSIDEKDEGSISKSMDREPSDTFSSKAGVGLMDGYNNSGEGSDGERDDGNLVIMEEYNDK